MGVIWGIWSTATKILPRGSLTADWCESKGTCEQYVAPLSRIFSARAGLFRRSSGASGLAMVNSGLA